MAQSFKKELIPIYVQLSNIQSSQKVVNQGQKGVRHLVNRGERKVTDKCQMCVDVPIVQYRPSVNHHSVMKLRKADGGKEDEGFPRIICERNRNYLLHAVCICFQVLK